jgi:hypothetical protein
MRAIKPCLLHEELSPILRDFRDPSPWRRQAHIDSEIEHKSLMEFLESFAPNKAKRCKLSPVNAPLRRWISSRIAKPSTQVDIRSGGYISIDQTEALVAIDSTPAVPRLQALEDTVSRQPRCRERSPARSAVRDMGGITSSTSSTCRSNATAAIHPQTLRMLNATAPNHHLRNQRHA